jgi:CRP-like cAMP-binding protein
MADDKKNLKKLVKEQSALVKSDPSNLVARLKLAGALKDIGRADEAVEQYTEVAKSYAATGKLVQAISVYKGILELRPRDAGIHAALTALNSKRAEEIQSKSVPRLQQSEGKWVLPGNESVPDDQGTDPGAATRSSTSSRLTLPTPSVLRLPAPVQEALSGRRGRRSRISFGPDDAPASGFPDAEPEPSAPIAPAEPPRQTGVPAQRMGGVSAGAGGTSLPRLFPGDVAPAEPARPGPGRPASLTPPRLSTMTAPRPNLAGVTTRPVEHVRLPEEPPELPTAERAPVTPRSPAGVDAPPGGPELVIAAEAPEDWVADEELEDEGDEETTSPGGATYKDTIRKSAVGLADVLETVALRSKAMEPPRRTLVGMPMPEQVERPLAEPAPLAMSKRPTPARPVPSPLLAAAARDVPEPAAPVEPPPELEPELPDPEVVEPPTREVVAVSPRQAAAPSAAPSEAETLGEVFSDDEEEIWNGLSQSRPRLHAEPTSAAAPLGEVPAAPAAPAAPAEVISAPPVKAPATKPRVAVTEPAPRIAVPAPTAGLASEPPGSGAVLARISLSTGRSASPSPATAPARAILAERPTSAAPAPAGPAPDVSSVEPSRPEAMVAAPPAAEEPPPFRIEQIDLFTGLSEVSQEALRSRIVKRDEKPGAVIVREGDPGNALFVVSSGAVRVTKVGADGQIIDLATLGAGSFFGEFALLSDRKRHATVTVVRNAVLYEISRKVISDLTKSDPVFGNTLRQFYRQRLLATLLNSAPFFQPLSAEERESLMGRLRFRRVPENTRIVTEGEPGGGFFLILIGEVEVSRLESDQSRKILARLGDGSYFGEMSLLKGGNAVATVTTRTPTEIVQLAASEFYRLLANYPQIWQEVNQESERRELANLQILSGRSPRSTSNDTGVVM